LEDALYKFTNQLGVVREESLIYTGVMKPVDITEDHSTISFAIDSVLHHFSI